MRDIIAAYAALTLLLLAIYGVGVFGFVHAIAPRQPVCAAAGPIAGDAGRGR